MFERARIRGKGKEGVSGGGRLLVGARSANERTTSPTSSFSKESMAKNTAVQDCEEVMENGDSDFDRELRNAIDKCVH